MWQLGVTRGGRKVMKGVFKLYDSVVGGALSDIVDTMWENGCVIDWELFLLDARKAGMKDKSIKKLIMHGLMDSANCQLASFRVGRLFGHTSIEED